MRLAGRWWSGGVPGASWGIAGWPVSCLGLEIFSVGKIWIGLAWYRGGIERGKAGNAPAFVVFGGRVCIVLNRKLNG